MRRAAIVTCMLSLVSCDQAKRMAMGDRDGGLMFAEDDLATADDTDGMMSLPEDMLMSFNYDFAGVDGGSAYVTDLARAADANGACLPGQTGIACAAPVGPNAGCIPIEVCNNGQDDNCDGRVDEDCICTPGDVQRCFLGAPGNRHVGACTDGQQTCIQVGEASGWGDCVGTIGPSAEDCDSLDNDCNGCADDGLCCGGVSVMCPAPGDARIADVAPFSTKTYKGADFFKGNATSWTWQVEGGPCDRLFASSDFTPLMNPPAQSFKVTGANAQDASIYFSLSGDYTVTLTIVDDTGHTYTCKWVQKVVAAGVRFELCWDHQGTQTQGGADLDLHVHKSGTTSNWFYAPTSVDLGACSGPHGDKCTGGFSCVSGRCVAMANRINADDCYFYNCTALQYTAPFDDIIVGQKVKSPNWYASSTPATNCQGNAKYGAAWSMLGYCANPRLDLDNVLTVAAPENSNIDTPGNGDTFRALVHYFGRGTTIACPCPAGATCNAGMNLCVDSNGNPIEGSAKSTAALEVHPLVNIYCGGALKATYGQKPNQLAGFNWGSQFATGQMWRVADVTAVVNGSGQTTDCTIKPLHPMGATSGYRVATAPNNTNLSYEGF